MKDRSGRTFQEKWIIKYPWIVYNSILDKVYCTECKNAVNNNIVLPINSTTDQNSKDTFTINGFSNWKKALQRFSSHEVKYL